MDSIMLVDGGTALCPRALMAWRERSALQQTAALSHVQGVNAAFGGTVIDHPYSTRLGPASCSPPA